MEDAELSIITQILTDLVVLSRHRYASLSITLQVYATTPKLLDQVRNVIRVKHFSLSTERAYVGWIRRFILFHHKKHRTGMAEAEIRQFISHLAVDAKISASTQTVALSALLFLYRDVLKRDLPHTSRRRQAENHGLAGPAFGQRIR